MLNIKSVVAGAVLAASSVAVLAQAAAPATPRVDKREARQEQRIQNGVASGQLTPRETQRLEREQAHINKAEQNAKADGVVTPQERKRLNHMQNRASKDIYRQKHDAQTAR
jgi:hypothetical protein